MDADIVDEINAACVGHPHAKIPWPHRLLHDARDEITRLREFVRDVAESDLDDMAADGVTVGMALQNRATQLIR